jgi:cation-transporting ATPase E
MLDEHKATGLTAEEVAERTELGQINRVRRSNQAEYLEILARNTLTVFNFLVAPAAVVLLSLGELRAGLAVCGMAVTNTLLGLIQEVRGKWLLDRLTLLAEARVRVMRDGVISEVLSGDVVRGDLVLLAAGGAVVADGTVESARFLEIDEALLTGESDPVPCKPGERLLSGSFCVAGEGSYVAEQVGAESFVQRTSQEARQYRYAASPLQENIDRLIKVLTWIAVALCGSYLVLSSARNLDEKDLVKMIAATITSMVPQGLVLMATLAFILGAVRLGMRGVIVRRLSAVETMASIDTLCMDKTGTLTTNRLHLERLVVLGGGPEAGVHRLLALFAGTSGDHGSKSLAAIHERFGATAGELIDFLPFKSQNRFSAVRVRDGGSEHVLVLGAFEALEPYFTPNGTADRAAWQALLATGLRVLLFAEATSGRDQFKGALDGFVLRPLGLIGLGDEVRPEAAGVLQKLAEQRIHFKVISGDNAETVRATIAPLASAAGLPDLLEGHLVTGAELEEADDRSQVVLTHSVFGRTSPWQKVEIVRLLRGAGRQVAMIGDGVNDVLPIKNAQLGIAMGEGSSAAQTVAAMVLRTNDFSLLPATLDEGRTIVRNLRRAGKLFLVKNVYTVLFILGMVGLMRLPFPYEPQQVTLLNFLTIGAPALLIMLGRDPSSKASARGFFREIFSFAIRVGIVIGGVGLALMWSASREWPGSPMLLHTLLLSMLVPLGAFTILRALNDGEERSSPRDNPLRLVALLGIVLYLIVMYVPPLAYFFELLPLDLVAWGWVLTAVAAGMVLMVASDWLWRRLTRPPAGGG